MHPDTDRFGRATVGVVVILVVAAAVTVGVAMAETTPTDGSNAVSTANQPQVEANQSWQNTTGQGPVLTRSGDTIHYSAPAGEAFGVANLTLSEADDAGTITASAAVSNANDWPSIQHVALRVDGDLVDRRPVALNPNETETVTFSVDTSEWPAGTHYVSVLSYESGATTHVTAETPVPSPTNATVTIDDQTSDGTTVTVSDVTVPDGGFVVVHESAGLAAGDAIGSTLGVSAYLEPGTHENVSVTLFDVPGVEFDATMLENDTNVTAMAHRDSNGNETLDFATSSGVEDGPYTVGGTAVVDDATISIESAPPSSETTTDEPTNQTTTEEPNNETTTEEPTNQTTTEEPTNQTTTEEPANETTTEEPTNETTTEEPTNETTTEQSTNETTTE